MEKPVSVRQTADIPEALELVERYCASMPNGSGPQNCPLVCEELLLRLLHIGFTDIRVSVKGLLIKYIEIRAAGERADALRVAPETEGDRIGTQISGCLLDQYTDCYTFYYRNGVNIYRVFAGKTVAVDLTGEIYAFYQAKESEKTTGARMCSGILRAGTGAFSRSRCLFCSLSISGRYFCRSLCPTSSTP